MIYEAYCKLKQQKKPIISNEPATLREQADAVEGAFDKAAVLVFNGLADEEEFFKLYHDMVLRFWAAAKDDIAEKQKRNKTAGMSFEKLVEQYMERVTECPLIDCKEFEKELKVEQYQDEERLRRNAKNLDFQEEITTYQFSGSPSDDETKDKQP